MRARSICVYVCVRACSAYVHNCDYNRKELKQLAHELRLQQVCCKPDVKPVASQTALEVTVAASQTSPLANTSVLSQTDDVQSDVTHPAVPICDVPVTAGCEDSAHGSTLLGHQLPSKIESTPPPAPAQPPRVPKPVCKKQNDLLIVQILLPTFPDARETAKKPSRLLRPKSAADSPLASNGDHSKSSRRVQFQEHTQRKKSRQVCKTKFVLVEHCSDNGVVRC